MASPPASPSYNLQGASRTTGGYSRGRALGNTLNHADFSDILDTKEIRKGKVYIYTTRSDPPALKPYMVYKHDVVSHLGPILKSLSRDFSPPRSKPLQLTPSYLY